MNFYMIASNVYDILDITYFANKPKNPRMAICSMIQGEGLRVLDMCCGTMANTIPAAKEHRDSRFLGIDLSQQMLRRAKNKIRQNGLTNTGVKCADATDSRIKGESLDYVVIGLALHEMTPILQRNILKETYRLLKPDGKLIVLEWERPKKIAQRILFFLLLVAEQVLNRHFLKFYRCDKEAFFRGKGFELCNMVHCSYSAVMEFRKADR